jgi:L-cystine transport system permease protein
MGFQFDFSFFIYEIYVGIHYIPVVILLSILPLFAGLVFGFLIAVTRLFRVYILSDVFTVLVVFIRGIPLVLQLTILYLFINLGFDSFARLLGLSVTSKIISYTVIALIGLSINATVYLSEVIRTALQSVNAGQYEAAYSVGMTSSQMMRRIILPQALPVAVPLIGNNLITLIKGSSVASLISVVEIISGTQIEATRNYKFLEAYIASAVIYWSMCIVVERLTKFFETRVIHYEKGSAI